MCNPLLMGATAQVAGIGMQNRAAQRAEERRADYLSKERERQRGFEDTARKSQEAATMMFGRNNFQPGVSTARQGLADRYSNMASRAMPVNVPISDGVPNIIKNAVIAEMADAKAKTAKQAANLAKLNSFSDYLTSTLSPALTGSGMDTKTQAAFMRGSSVPLSLELNAANQLASSPLAQALQLGGQLGVGYGMMKKA